MNEQNCIVRFPGTNYDALILEKHQNLSEHLTVQNSPVLFGCRTGICGTCLVVVKGNVPPPSAEEAEVLENLSPGNNRVRLACQLEPTCDIEITLLPKESATGPPPIQ